MAPIVLVVLTILSFATYPFADLRMELAGIHMPYSTLLLLILDFLCLPRLMLRGSGGRRLPALPWAVVGLWLSMLVPVSLGADPDWEWIVRYAMFFGLPVFLPTAIESLPQLRLAVLVLLLVGLFLALYGYSLFLEKGLGYYDLHYTESTRNGDAALMSTFALLALAYCLRGRGGKGRLLLSLVLTAVFGVAALLSFSRGVWLGLAAGVLSLGYFRSRRDRAGQPRLRKFVALGVLLAVLIFAIPRDAWQQLGRRFSSFVAFNEDPQVSNRERLKLYTSCIGIVSWEGWVGAGVRNFGHALQKRAPELRVQHAHNGYLNIWAEQGLLGVVSYLVVTLCPIWVLKRNLLGLPWTTHTWVLSGLLSAAIAWAIYSLFDTLYLSFFHWLLNGMVTAAALLSGRPAAHPGFPTRAQNAMQYSERADLLVSSAVDRQARRRAWHAQAEYLR